MKKIILLSILFLQVVFIRTELDRNFAFARSKTIRIDNIDLPRVNSLTAKNGLKLFYIKDELPRLIIVLSAGFGKLHENSSNAGVSDLLARTLSLAGSKKYPADVLHNTIESIGGRFSVQSSFEETQIVIEVIEKYSGLAFDIMTDMILNPNIDSKIMGKARSLLLEDLRRKKDNPDMLAFDKSKEIIFNGAGYGAYPTENSLNSISGKDLQAILNDYFTAKNTIMGIASSQSFNEIENNLKGLEVLREGAVMNYYSDVNALAASLPEKSKKIYLLPKNIPQAVIVVGTIAPDIKDAGIYALSLMNDILGGSDFSSRLMHEIRVKRGLAYSVQSTVRFRKNTGIFFAFAQTRNETADTALSLILENIEQISISQVKNEELKSAKGSLKNSYIFEFDTPVSILKKYAFLSYNDLSESFLFDYVKRVESVSREEIQKESLKLFDKGLVKLVVGKKELEKSLSKFGKVVIIE